MLLNDDSERFEVAFGNDLRGNKSTDFDPHEVHYLLPCLTDLSDGGRGAIVV